MDPTKAVEQLGELSDLMRDDMTGPEQADFDVLLADRFRLAGGAASTMAVGEQVTKPETELEKALPGFLDPEVKLSANQQLEVNARLWNELGVAMPGLTEEQSSKLEAVAAENPDKRIVAAPLLNFDDRNGVAEAAKQNFAKSQFDEKASALWTPVETFLYGKLSHDPSAVVADGKDRYALGFKAPDGTIVSQADYEASLKAAGIAVTAEDGRTWVFSVMDVRVQSPRQNDTAARIHSTLGPTATEDSFLATQLLHQANGTPNPYWTVDFANKGVYKVTVENEGQENQRVVYADKKGRTNLVRVAGVGWDPGNRQVGSDYWWARSRGDDFGARAEVSGL